MKNSLTAKTTAIILIVAAVLIYIGTMTLNLAADRLANSYLASKQFQLVDLLDQIVLDMSRADAQEREYVLTGDIKTIEQYKLCFDRIDACVAKLKTLLSDNSRYSMLLDELTDSISFRKSCAEEVIQVRSSGGMESALARSDKFDEGHLTKHVEWLAKEVSGTINSEMTARFSELDKASLTTLIGISFILISALLALLIVILGVNRYVSERHRAEEALRAAQQALSEREARMRALVETAPDGIVTIRSDGTIESVNAVLENLCGVPASDLIGVDIERIIPSFLLDGRISDLASGQRSPFSAGRELYAVRQDGSHVPVEVSTSTVSLGREDVYTGIVRDITERKEVEERVKDFYSMVSHELRTPLASIRTALGLMESFSDELSDKTRPVVRIAAAEADRLMRLINDILDMRKIESGKLELALDAFDASDLLRKAIEGIDSLAHQAQVAIENQANTALDVYCDGDRILQVLSNILANAVKYSPSPGKVIVACEKSGSSCKISVRDFGPGVAKNQAHKLFGRFEQLRAKDGKNRAGSGLGLAIAKAIVEQHGGEIGVELPDGGGSIFWFSLPLAEDEIESLELDEDELAQQAVQTSQSIQSIKSINE
ncbi:MAG: domain S-box protein [Cyanobacteriota bacterium erpe_2018_sw_21hr_WHONDRS-SW48-000092_B_bin.40]|nr:domain S-box protein [Cyanobacteriota bacterium erpe_2018_sw_21hr_WHONDRS-SW48-000092_B_bin.40]